MRKMLERLLLEFERRRDFWRDCKEDPHHTVSYSVRYRIERVGPEGAPEAVPIRIRALRLR